MTKQSTAGCGSHDIRSSDRDHWKAATPLCSLLTLAVIVLFSGCGGSDIPANRPKTVPVNGIIKQKGTPIAGVTVAFIPSTSNAIGAVGVTNEKGEFRLMTFAPGDGAVPGPYKVTLTKSVVEGGELTEDSSAKSTAVTKHLINSKYANPNSSGFAVNVEEGKENHFPFDLD